MELHHSCTQPSILSLWSREVEMIRQGEQNFCTGHFPKGFAAVIFKFILPRVLQRVFSNSFCWNKCFAFWFKFHWSLLLRLQFTTCHHCFRLWLAACLATNYYLNQSWPNSIRMWLKQETIFHGDEVITLTAIPDSIYGTKSIGLWNADSSRYGPSCIVFVIRLSRNDRICLDQRQSKKKGNKNRTIFSNALCWFFLCILILISVNFVPEGATDDKSILVQVTIICLFCDKPFNKWQTTTWSMLAQFYEDVIQTRHHLLWRWGDYSDSPFNSICGTQFTGLWNVYSWRHRQ